jgi:hypothetical protein
MERVLTHDYLSNKMFLYYFQVHRTQSQQITCALGTFPKPLLKSLANASYPQPLQPPAQQLAIIIIITIIK